jgi:hypothetical protein
MRNVLDRLTYANVTATLALFIALGGTSYAVATLPRNSVGPAQLRENAVRGGEIRRQAVKSSDIGDRAVRLRDISKSARESLQGQVGPAGPQGPAGPTFFATLNSVGTPVRGAVGTDESGAGVRVVEFRRSMANCVPAASVTALANDPNGAPPAGASIRTEVSPGGRVVVRTWDPGGTPTFYAFNLIVAC